MRKFVSVVLIMLLVAMISTAQDTTPTPTPTQEPTETATETVTPVTNPTATPTQSTSTTNTTRATPTNQTQIQRWIEVRVGNTGSVGYIPAACASDVQLDNVVLWTGDRSGSLSAASQSLNDVGQDDFTGIAQILATIYCDVALYSTPDGEQVADTRLIPGQTWFVSPYVYVTDANAVTRRATPTPTVAPRSTTNQGQANRGTTLPIDNAWAEVIIGNTGQQVYIPASCVPGEPYNETITWTGSRSGSFVDDAALENDDDTGNDIGNPTLVTILCDVTVLSAPGGPAVENTQIRAGQTWYVTPYLWVQADNMANAQTDS
ncbi:MAG: hypothetical protein OHK0046_31350 [Anaerolineae bacterium]